MNFDKHKINCCKRKLRLTDTQTVYINYQRTICEKLLTKGFVSETNPA